MSREMFPGGAAVFGFPKLTTTVPRNSVFFYPKQTGHGLIFGLFKKKTGRDATPLPARDSTAPRHEELPLIMALRHAHVNLRTRGPPPKKKNPPGQET